MVDWSCYLKSICNDPAYDLWSKGYTLTDVTSQKQTASGRPGGRLMTLSAQTVPSTAEDGKPKDDQVEQLTVLEGLRKYAKEHVLLQGAPGSGKSTALARLMLEEAEHNQDEAKGVNQASTLGIPVLVELRYYETSVIKCIHDFLRSHDPSFSRDESLGRDEIEQWLIQGQLLLLIDGVNELPSEAARRDLQQFRLLYKTTPMIFTTRELVGAGDLKIQKKLTMQPLTEAQMSEFVQAYLGPGPGEAMLSKLGDRLKQFGRAPLLLWMLCSVFDSNQKIPENLGFVFQQFTQNYDNTLKQDVPNPNQSRSFWSELLQELAYQMLTEGDPKEVLVAVPRFKAEGLIRAYLRQAEVGGSLEQAKLWLEDLLKYHLIQLGANDQIEFRHQLIQEYYAAERLLKELESISDKNLKWEYLNYLKWTEPLALMAGMVFDEGQALRLVRLALETDYELGARLAGAVDKRWHRRTVEMIADLSISPIFRIWLLGRTKSEAAVAGLIAALSDEASSVRQRAAEALGKIGGAAAVAGLIAALSDENWSVRQRAAEALGQIGDAVAVAGLLSALSDEDWSVRRRAAEALGQIGGAAAVAVSALSDEDWSVRRRAAIARQ